MSQGGLSGPWEIFKVSLHLGLTSFGGPIAHLGYFHKEYVEKRKWLSEDEYTELIALCQFLPGPASSQAGIGIGTLRGGIWGGLAAWVGFTLPSALFLALMALLARDAPSLGPVVHGLKIVAVAVVLQAVFNLWQKLVKGPAKIALALLSALLALWLKVSWSHILIISLAAVCGLLFYAQRDHNSTATLKKTRVHIPHHRAFLILFFAILVFLPAVRSIPDSPLANMFDSFYRSGALVFGGGHVILPLLEKELVPHLMEADPFLAGYGLAQAVPGPLFTVAAYWGASMQGISGALVGTIAVFLPAFLLIWGILPYWQKLKNSPRAQGVLAAVNASVVGILLAALINPLWTSTLKNQGDYFLLVLLAGFIFFRQWAPWKIVLLGLILGPFFYQ